MPNRDGLEVYAEILQHFPKLKVVLMSGYNEQSVASRLGPDAPVPAFLHKPFRANELLGMIEKALS
jgi:CheY-like chemotaxis protein